VILEFLLGILVGEHHTNRVILPNISVVIPVYNGEKSIVEVLDSILGQTYPVESLEIIVVDNNSTDKTSSLVRSYKSLPIKYVFETKQGRSFARNTGWKSATHEHILFLDSDTRLKGQWLRYMIQLFEKPTVMMAQGLIKPLCTDKKDRLYLYRIFSKLLKTNQTNIETKIINNFFPIVNTASSIIRKSILMEMGGFNEELATHEDIALSNQISRAGYVVGYCEDAVSFVTWDSGTFLSYFIREFERGRALNSLNSFMNYKRLNYWYHSLQLVQTCFKSVSINMLIYFIMNIGFMLGHLYGRIINKKIRNVNKQQEVSCLSLEYNEEERLEIIKQHLSILNGMSPDNKVLSGFSVNKEVRITSSLNTIIFHHSKNKKTFEFKGDQFYFLDSLLNNTDSFYCDTSKYHYELVANLVIDKLFQNEFIHSLFCKSKIVLSSFTSFRKVNYSDGYLSHYVMYGGSKFNAFEASIIHADNYYTKEVITFLDSNLSKEDWYKVNFDNIEDKVIDKLSRLRIVRERIYFDSYFTTALSLSCYLNDDNKWKTGGVLKYSDDLVLDEFLMSQIMNKENKLDIYKSDIKQMNNFMSQNENAFWVRPINFSIPVPVYIDDEQIKMLLNFTQNDWTVSQCLDFVNIGIIKDRKMELGFSQLDISSLRKSFEETDAFHAPQAISPYVRWMTSNFLKKYFDEEILTLGDFQCADRKTIYDNALCLHLQAGFAELASTILPFKVSLSFNYTVLYTRKAQLDPHHDREEAPFAMSLILGSYDSNGRNNQVSKLGFIEEDNTHKIVDMYDGDIALFNGAKKRHYRPALADDHQLLVMIMLFVPEDFKGGIG
jgi:glycosyltransferase involved in cell wall biosynthesis